VKYFKGRKKMFRNIMIFIVGILMISLTGCDLKTPEIRGVVLDAETKQPVEGAWIQATLQIKSKTIAGEVHKVISIAPPHTRTNNKGEFVIPSKESDKPSFAISFGVEIENFSVNASTINDMSGGFFLKDYEGKKKIEIVIYVKPWEKGLTNEREYFSYLQALYNYCFSGRFGVEVHAMEGGCDEWELNYSITKHERFLTRIGEPKTKQQENNYAGTMKQLGYLYKRKKDYKKALETFTKARDFDRKLNVKLWIKEYDNQINELQQVIKKNQD
jgi:hypothetical protein